MQPSRLPLDDLDTAAHAALPLHVLLQQWRHVPPVLRGEGVTLRELKIADAPALLATLSPGDLSRLAGPFGANFDGVADFIDRSRDDRALGQAICFGVIPASYTSPVGVFRVVATEPEFGCAEWTFALAPAFWGGGLFFLGAPLVADFVFDVLGARRLEARVSVRNGRGSGALRKLGAAQEALMRHALLFKGEAVDLVLWTIIADEWRRRRPSGPHIH